MHVDTLIELAIQRSLRGSLRGLAEQMGVSSGIVSQWKLGNKPIPDERIQQLARIAGQEAGPWLLLIHSEQDQGDLGREWAKLYKRLGMAALALVLCIGAALPGRAEAAVLREIHHAFTLNAADITLTVYTLCEVAC
ncbi:DUF3693 domain-containing protein [Xanthomonas arboricola]|uniref:DUF3693 domain-containing protein n=2 Tax=Xanthomonas arboricola pv. pruni TaxID=69929 RepID=A0AAP4KEE6_9XANT|nr:DUF3693 domain-containing protein [Xanthomonas arboricola]MDN0289146.1 DUF3693 domain-containing protein [Xanthomonas arboricola pv. pruni]MDN0293298.1 DUF3693 domain-containing protein [Xanthomonas arboricola pv. pruni]MDN0297400.1 DUF3693 domain-containing protein [Xanthomonas arboricola pv. pruni]MDN0301504.1 DUF3693 domain-containing protein [Xanthomonas arboricola pv. pruni]MDN0305641.1 DUF3693 domain-containing protein [Xanthomonas arboricola pv. pruni]